MTTSYLSFRKSQSQPGCEGGGNKSGQDWRSDGNTSRRMERGVGKELARSAAGAAAAHHLASAMRRHVAHGHGVVVVACECARVAIASSSCCNPLRSQVLSLASCRNERRSELIEVSMFKAQAGAASRDGDEEPVRSRFRMHAYMCVFGRSSSCGDESRS